MALVNRDKDVSEQNTEVTVNLGAVATGTTKGVWIAPYPCTVSAMQAAAAGVSNAMQLALQVQRGATTGVIQLGISNLILQNYSVSGFISYSGLAAPGATVLNLVKGDALQVVSSVSNGNATDLTVSLVIKKTQDILSFY